VVLHNWLLLQLIVSLSAVPLWQAPVGTHKGQGAVMLLASTSC
jgi:hypothetical protein